MFHENSSYLKINEDIKKIGKLFSKNYSYGLDVYKSWIQNTKGIDFASLILVVKIRFSRLITSHYAK